MVMASMKPEIRGEKKKRPQGRAGKTAKDVDGTAEALAVRQDAPEDGKNDHHGCAKRG
jgi:hypothetical protein